MPCAVTDIRDCRARQNPDLGRTRSHPEGAQATPTSRSVT